MPGKEQARLDPAVENSSTSEESNSSNFLSDLSLGVGSGSEPPPVERAVQRLRQTKETGRRQSIFRSLGRSYGNKYVSQVAAAAKPSKIESLQRNPAAVAPTQIPTLVQRDPATESSSPPPPLASKIVEPAAAQVVLQSTFGNIKRIVEGKFVLLENIEAMWQARDEYCIRNKKKFKKANPPRDWQPGDAKLDEPDVFNGFADVENGISYVNKQTTSPTTTVHEMLHQNCASGFGAAVGNTINEGITQTLAVKALKAVNVPLSGSIPYQDEMALVQKLVPIVGEGTLTQAYFGGASILIKTFEATQGEGSFDKVKEYWGKGKDDKAELYLKPPSLEQKVAIVNDLLDGWVTDEDISNIERIYKVAGAAEKTALKNAISPRISELNNFGQRGRLHLLIGD